MTPTDYPILRFFEYRHLADHLQAVSKRFHDLAYDLAVDLPANEETEAALRWLLLCKDSAVRSMLAAAG